MTDNDSTRQPPATAWMGICIASGLILGFVVGRLIDAYMVSILIGIALGVIVGAILMKQMAH